METPTSAEYLIRYSIGSNRHDARAYTRRVQAASIAEAAMKALAVKALRSTAQRRVIITSVELVGGAFA